MLLVYVSLSISTFGYSQWTLSYEGSYIPEPQDKLIFQGSADAVYFRTVTNLYKSVNKGVSWSLVLETGTVIYDRIDDYFVQGNQIWVLGHESEIGYFLKYSNDAGATWVSKTITDYPKESIVYHNGILFMGCQWYLPGNDYTLYRSFDNGDNWEPVINNEQLQSTCKGLFEFNDMLFAYYGPGIGMYWSDDSGDTWHRCNNETTFTEAYSYGISITPLGLTVSYIPAGFGYAESAYSKDGIEWSRDVIPGLRPYTFDGTSQKWFTQQSEGTSHSLNFSFDEGNSWFEWSESTDIYAEHIFLYKDILFAANVNYIYWRPISEAVSPPPPTPEEIESSGGMESLLTYYGVDSPSDLPENILEVFLDYFEDSDTWDSPIAGMQPGSCSSMGMPTWKVNSASNQLYIKDIIFNAAALGPNPTVDMYYNKNLPFHHSTLGNSWSLGFDIELEVAGENVFITSGELGKKVFSNTSKKNNTAVWRENKFSPDSISFDGTKWHYYVKNKRLVYNFSNVEPNIFLLESITDFDNNTLLVYRNQDNKISKIADASGREIDFSYNGAVCTGFTLIDGRSAGFSYHSNGLLNKVTDLAGAETNYLYDNDDELISIDIEGKETTFSYGMIHGFNRVVSTNAYSGQQISYEFNPIDSLTNISKIVVDGIGKSYTSVSGKTTKVEVDYGLSKSRTLNDEGLLETFEGSGGIDYAISYDNKGNPSHLYCEDEVETTLTWDAKHNLTSKTNALSNTWNYQYDSYGRLTKITSPENRQKIFEYYSNGLLKKLTRGDLITSYEYDIYGNKIRVINPNGGVTTYEYDEYGYQLLSITSPEGRKTSYNYDENNRMVKVLYSDGSEVELLYDCCTQIGKIDENGHENLLSRTNAGFISQFIDAEGNETNWEYNDRGQPTSVQNTSGNTTSYVFNDKDMIAQLVDEELGVQKYWYNNQNKLVRLQNPNNITTKYLRDNDGELVGIIYPNYITNPDTIKYTRNNIGQITSISNLRNQTINTTYDRDGNALSRTYGSETDGFDWDDNTGLFIGYSDNSGNTLYERNASGFVKKITYPNGLSVQFEYDLDGNQTKLTYPEGFSVNNTVNNRGRVTTLAWENKTIALSYDGVGNLLEEERNSSSRSTYTYNDNNQLNSISHFESDALFSDFQFTRDVSGRITNIDMLPAIIPTKAPDLWYDYITRNDNQLFSNMKAEAGTQAYYSYDPDGNCNYASGTVQFEATYTQLNQLSTFELGNNSVTITYDAMGNANSINKNGISKLFYYDHKGRLLFETDLNGNVGRYYIYKAKRIMAFVENGKSYYLQYDQSGNTIYIRNEDNTIVNRYIYSSFGEVLARQEQISYQFTYNGAFGVFEIADGYYLMRTRLYQAINGRFLQRDPLNLYGDVNGYRFVGNNPFSGTDPYGMAEDENSSFNSSSLDGGYDAEPGVAGGTEDIYNYNISYESNAENDPINIISEYYEEATSNPLADLLPSSVADPIAYKKALDKYNNGEGILAIAWQFVPYNNTLEMIYKEKRKEIERKNWNYYHMPDGTPKWVAPPSSTCNWW